MALPRQGRYVRSPIVNAHELPSASAIEPRTSRGFGGILKTYTVFPRGMVFTRAEAVNAMAPEFILS